MSRSEKTNVARRYLRKMSRRSVAESALESVSAETLSSDRVREAHSRAVAAIERESGGELDSSSKQEIAKLFLQDGAQAVERLKNEGVDANLTADHQAALEAIVEFDGSRPTLPVSEQDRIDSQDLALGEWQPVAKQFEEQISKVASAVGRIDIDGQHCGTGFVVKDGLVLTNRHVLQGLAEQNSSGTWTFLGEPTITFNANPDEDRTRQFKLRKRVILAGPDFINPLAIDYNKLDFAVLECELPDSGSFPEPLPLESDADKIVVSRPVFTIGYPAKPKPNIYPPTVVDQLFESRFGIKRFAPGEIDRGLGSASANTGETVFTHDSTTLAGNSGSCVADFGNDGLLLVGLHFGGRAESANYAHSNAKLEEVLGDLGLTWRAWL